MKFFPFDIYPPYLWRVYSLFGVLRFYVGTATVSSFFGRKVHQRTGGSFLIHGYAR